MAASLQDMTQQARALKAAGRFDEALAIYRAAAETYASSAVAAHNLASALGDAGHWREAYPIIRSALKGSDAAETWLVCARAEQALGRLDAADQAYRAAIARRPTLADAQRELAQLRWMRGENIEIALSEVDAALAQDGQLLLVKAQALEFGGADEAAFALLDAACAQRSGDAAFAMHAARCAVTTGRYESALAHAERAVRLAPGAEMAHGVHAEALLALGRAEAAASVAAEFRRLAPHNQFAIALQAIAWRLLGDRRYGALYDYSTLVEATSLAVPVGWSDLATYLRDLGAALHAAHHFETHPFAQSIRRGSQAANILDLDHPAIRALPEALDAPIRAYISKLGAGADPLRVRMADRYKFQGIWSIRMRAGGRHVDHIHPEGWISSAAYVEVPSAAASDERREGWIRFGKPGTPTQPDLDAEYFLAPKPGRLVLFPSYMWHGTTPFTGDDQRLTFAFDLVPHSARG